jgi:hypothetical protein
MVWATDVFVKVSIHYLLTRGGWVDIVLYLVWVCIDGDKVVLDESFQPRTTSSSKSSDLEEEKTAYDWQEPNCVVCESNFMELMKFCQTSCHCPTQGSPAEEHSGSCPEHSSCIRNHGSIHCGIHETYLEVTCYTLTAKTNDAGSWCIISTLICWYVNMFQ